MLTICTNDETNRDELIQALVDSGLKVQRADEICEVDENDIWQGALRRFDRTAPEPMLDYRVAPVFRDWNGGRFCQFGHRSAGVHSDTSAEDAAAAAKILRQCLAAEIAAWKFEAAE